MKNTSFGRVAALIAAGGLTLGVLSGCGLSKITEPTKDAPVSGRNTAPAVVGSMPDGFSNWSAKCDGPNMVYVLFKGDAAYGSLNVVKDDPRCTGDQ